MVSSDRVHIGYLVAAILLALAMVVLIGAASEQWGGMDFDPQWIENALTGLVVVGCWFAGIQLWRCAHAMCQFVAFLRGDVADLSPAFAATFQRLARVIGEEMDALEAQRELMDG